MTCSISNSGAYSTKLDGEPVQPCAYRGERTSDQRPMYPGDRHVHHDGGPPTPT